MAFTLPSDKRLSLFIENEREKSWAVLDLNPVTSSVSGISWRVWGVRNRRTESNGDEAGAHRRNPRHYTVDFDDRDDGMRRLASCPHQVAPNAFHDA
jgi:hypothetical protein